MMKQIQKGFTLVEMIMAIMLMSMIALIIGVIFNTMFSSRELIGFYQGRKWRLFLLSDKKFLLWNPLAGVKGDYQEQKDGMIWLQPQKEPLFLVYARNDKDLSKDKIRVELVNFQLGKNYIYLERGGYYSVSNEDNDLVHTFA